METKKKILVFIPQFPVLTETFIERELSKLVERNNIDLAIVALSKGEGNVSDNLRNKINYKRLSLYDAPYILLFFLTHFSKILSLVSSIEGKCCKKLFLVLKAIGYSRYFSTFKPDLIFSHFMSEPSTIAMISSKLIGVPFAISAHARDIIISADNIAKKVEWAEFITICNKNAYNSFLELVSEEYTSNVFVSYHGVDVNKLVKDVNQSDEKLSKLDRPLVLGVGRLTEKKGFKYLIEASKILKDKGVYFYTFIIGSGPLYFELEEQIKKLDLIDYVSILGGNKGLPNIKVLKYLSIADVFVLPSIQTREGDVDGVANVLLEAGAFKLPIVATNAGSTLEVIKDNETGLVVPQENANTLADSIDKILKDENLSTRLGQGAYIKIIEDFDLNKNVEKLELLLMQ
ncbi:glycosyltransferase family 4 protein [candidate division WWE3 bacterium]|uniref:Glycosyltransferase family 4 protein n=1 Tax=candidate division WWE3 bacterium TaxID=2053526 RepID=A0A7X9E6L3_UNCKA|nr:glycosyltransferase family 4 protein [candidate division WWE3 bacterium]